MTEWLKGCEVCNAGLVAQVDSLVDGGISVRKACDLMAEEGRKQIGDMVYSAAAIRARYRLHKGLRDPHPEKVGHSDPPQQMQNQAATQNLLNEVRAEREPDPTELSSKFHRQAAQASAQSNNKPSELERAATTIKQAARLLERIVEGNIKDNGSEYDKLSAESIRRHGPSIIISYYQLGIDPEKAVNFYKGESNGKKAHIKGST